MKIKLLIVDDSRIFRSAVEESLAGESDIEVVGSVWSGLKAIDFIQSRPPDIVTLDLEMPYMSGLETLEAIQKINASKRKSRPIGVIMLSSHTQNGADITVKALEMGAFDFISKPEGKNLEENILILRYQLVTKIRSFALKSISSAPSEPCTSRSSASDIISNLYETVRIRSILIGVSTGGPKALAEILPPLCEKVDVPIFIVQHMPPAFTQSLAKSLNARCRYTVMEGKNNDIVRDKHVYIAPGGRHMLLTKKGQTVRIVVSNQPPVKGCRPSVDILFRSGATVYGRDTIGVILTGMGGDGTEGARMLKRTGAVIIAQDEDTSVVWGMPGSAKASGNVDRILPLKKIPNALIGMIIKSGFPENVQVSGRIDMKG